MREWFKTAKKAFLREDYSLYLDENEWMSFLDYLEMVYIEDSFRFVWLTLMTFVLGFAAGIFLS
ncbi:MAG: hypothetical protein V1721_09160 [Pseudomonadota bacterium]